MRKLLIGLDVDGTIVHYDGHASERVTSAIKAVLDAGHEVVIATGRSVTGTVPIVDLLGLTSGFLVCSNGAVTAQIAPEEPHGYRLLDCVTFDPRPVLDRLRGAWPDGVVATEVIGEGYLVSDHFPDGELLGDVKVVPWEELAQPTTRITFRSPSGTAEEFVKLADGLGLHGVNYGVGYSAWLDINPEGVSKASALEKIREHHDIDVADTVAVGDHRNDIEMLGWAGRGVAMGQAPDDVKAIADGVTDTVEEDGLAQVLEGLL
ncbi:HAD family phosphatase [Yimella sp. cx-573]|nr:HAD family phosphatase [Yimella sp. cx-573]